MIPMRANIVGLPSIATRNQAFRCHLGRFADRCWQRFRTFRWRWSKVFPHSYSRLFDNFELQPCQQCCERNRAEEKTSAKHERVDACCNGGGQAFADTVMLRQ